MTNANPLLTDSQNELIKYNTLLRSSRFPNGYICMFVKGKLSVQND